MCPAKPSRCNPRQARANHATMSAGASSEIDSSCYAAGNAPAYAGNAPASFPTPHGVATAVEQSARDVPHDPAVAALKRNFQLDVNWRGGSHAAEPVATQAPLASPEPLSETSSLASFGSDSFRRQPSGDRRWFSRPAVRMDPIKQSPLCRSSPPSARLVLSSATQSSTAAVTAGLCFPLEDISSNADSEPDTAACPVVRTVSATPVWPPASTCQTVVEVHHHQDSPTQNRASRSLADPEQMDDVSSAELLTVYVQPSISSAASADGHETVYDDISVADMRCSCSHSITDCTGECEGVSDAAGVSESEKVDGDGDSNHLRDSNITEFQSSLSPYSDDTSDVVGIVDSEVNRVMVDRL